MAINLFKTAAEGQVFRPADFNGNMSAIETAVNQSQVDIDALEAGRVQTTGNETIAGVKTFSSSPVVPNPTLGTDAANKTYVDGLDASNVHLTGSETVAGVKTFSDSPVVPTPTTDYQASTKKYVDDKAVSYAAPIGHVGAGGDAHADAVAGSSDGFMTGSDKAKLDGIATGAEVNQNAFSTVAVTGQASVIADSKMDTFTLKPGSNITITTDPDTDEITINATGTVSTAAENTSLADAAGRYTAINAEDAFAEIAGAGRTTETVKGNADAIATKVGLTGAETVAGVKTFSDSPIVPTPAVNDNSTKVANTAFYNGQASSTTPVMDGVAAVGSSQKFARADHVHPTDTSRAPFILNNYTATSDPTTGDDSADGYTVGSEWINTSTDKSYKCLDATAGAAIWVNFASAIKRYGFRRAKANSDPTARIEYLYDAVGFTPAAMNFGTGVFGYGSWQTFVEEVCRPVMLKLDGTVDYELSRTDFTKKADGITASDISNTAYVGNAMIEFRKYKWVKRYEDATHEYVIFADGQYDDTYNAYAHTNALGTVKPAFYWGAFKGSNISSKLKSFADQTIMVSQTRNTEASYAAANGAGYYTIYKSGWDFICDLLTLIGKTDSAQTIFGTGRIASASALATGTLKAQPMFKGYNDNTSDVKVFGIEGFWGNVWEGMAGLVFNGNIRTKMVPSYNFDGAGYVETGIVPSGTNGGYVSSAGVTDASGYVPKVASGSASTYYCDGLWYNNAQVDYALVGGGWNGGLLAGPRSVVLDFLASGAGVGVGSRLSYLNPA